MAILNKISITKKKNQIEIAEDVKEKMRAMKAQIRRNVGINLVTKIISTPLETSNYEETEEYKEFEQTYRDYPDAVHYILQSGDNLITFAYKQRKLGMLFNVIKKVGLGEIAEAKFGEKEPLCFALFEAKNLRALEEMDEYLRENRLNPKDANGNKWSEVYKKTYPIIKMKEVKIFNEFRGMAEKNNNQMKYYNRELRTK